MTSTQHRLRICLSFMLAWPHIGSIDGRGRSAAADDLDRQPPVVSAPRHPGMIVHGEGHLAPARHGKVSRSARCRCQPESVRASAPAASGLPFGAANRALFGAQVANGQAARLVLYQYDFVPSKAGLSAAGRLKLARLAPLLASSPFPLIIEPHGGAPELDELRRRNVVAKLANLVTDIPAERVIVAPPPSPSISGVEAHNLHLRLLEMSAVGGLPEATAVPVSPTAPR